MVTMRWFGGIAYRYIQHHLDFDFRGIKDGGHGQGCAVHVVGSGIRHVDTLSFFVSRLAAHKHIVRFKPVKNPRKTRRSREEKPLPRPMRRPTDQSQGENTTPSRTLFMMENNNRIYVVLGGGRSVHGIYRSLAAAKRRVADILSIVEGPCTIVDPVGLTGGTGDPAYERMVMDRVHQGHFGAC